MYVYIVHKPRNWYYVTIEKGATLWYNINRDIILSKTKFWDNTIKFYHILSIYFFVLRNRSFVGCIVNYQNAQNPLYTYTSMLLQDEPLHIIFTCNIVYNIYYLVQIQIAKRYNENNSRNIFGTALWYPG